MESPNPNIPKILGKNHESTIVVGDFVQVSLSADIRSRKRATFFAEVTEVFQDRSEVALSYIKKVEFSGSGQKRKKLHVKVWNSYIKRSHQLL